MLQEYRGLSRVGRMFNAAVSATLPLSTYDNYKKKLCASYTQTLASFVSRNRALFTLDNYNHFYNTPTLMAPGVRSTQYQTCNYTVVALSRFEQSLPDSLDLGFVEISKQSHLESFPSRLKI
jgi:hypothetical protein